MTPTTKHSRANFLAGVAPTLAVGSYYVTKKDRTIETTVVTRGNSNGCPRKTACSGMLSIKNLSDKKFQNSLFLMSKLLSENTKDVDLCLVEEGAKCFSLFALDCAKNDATL